MHKKLTPSHQSPTSVVYSRISRSQQTKHRGPLKRSNTPLRAARFARCFHYVSSRRRGHTEHMCRGVTHYSPRLIKISRRFLKLFNRTVVSIGFINICFSDRIVFARVLVSVLVSIPRRNSQDIGSSSFPMGLEVLYLFYLFPRQSSFGYLIFAHLIFPHIFATR